MDYTAVDTSFPALKELWDKEKALDIQTPEQRCRFNNLLVGLLSVRVTRLEWQAIIDIAAVRYKNGTTNQGPAVTG